MHATNLQSIFVRQASFAASLFSAILGILLFVTNPARSAPISGNLELWLKADAGVEEAIGDPAEPGDTVLRWLDQSGNGRILEQANAAKRPDYLASPINSKPALEFNGTNQWMQGNPITGLASSSITIFGVATGDSNLGPAEEQALFAEKYWSGLVLERGTSTNPASGILTLYSNYNLGPAPNIIVSPNGNLPTTGFGPTLLAAQKVLHTSAAIYIDGTLQASTVVANSAITEPHAAGNINIGYHEYNVESYTSWDGKIAELLVYSRALNSAEVSIVNNHLAAKYDLTISGDRYFGDDVTKGHYDFDVLGIGREADGASTSNSAAGLTIAESGASLANGEYVLAGHKTTVNSINPDGTWARVWYVDKTETTGIDATLTFDFSDAGLGTPSLSGPWTQIALLYSPTDPFNFNALGIAGTVSGDSVSFLVLNSQLLDGYFTLQTLTVPEPSTFALLGLGAIGLAIKARRRRTAA